MHAVCIIPWLLKLCLYNTPLPTALVAVQEAASSPQGAHCYHPTNCWHASCPTDITTGLTKSVLQESCATHAIKGTIERYKSLQCLLMLLSQCLGEANPFKDRTLAQEIFQDMKFLLRLRLNSCCKNTYYSQNNHCSTVCVGMCQPHDQHLWKVYLYVWVNCSSHNGFREHWSSWLLDQWYVQTCGCCWWHSVYSIITFSFCRLIIERHLYNKLTS